MSATRRWSWLLILGLAVVLAVVALITLAPSRSVRGKSAAQPLSDDLLPQQTLAQDLALLDSRVQGHTVGRRAEVFGVHAIADGHYPVTSAACDSAECWRVEIYNFDDNAAVTAIVNVDTRQVLDVLHLPNMHPGINQRLIRVAEEIAFNDPQVIEVLGFRPTKGDMAPVESNLTGTSCESDNLCGAITFELGDRVLWAVVDLTREELAGIGYTDMEQVPPSTERAEPRTPQDCFTAVNIDRDGWQLDYVTTSSDGLMITDAAYNGELVLTQAKLVEMHAAYWHQGGGYWSGYVDAVGCSPYGGFPIYPFGPTQVIDIMDGGDVIGFEVIQDFRMSNWGSSCNYRYEQHYQFYTDGRFRVVSGAYGKGCGSNALYRPVERIDLAAGGDDANDNFAAWDGTQWVDWTTEAWSLQTEDTQYTPEGYLYRLTDASGAGLYMEPGQGQFEDAGLGDFAYIYVTRHNPAEGDADLGAIGTCCNDNHQQGPHNYLNGESVVDQNIVIWYVAQHQTDTAPGREYCWTALPNTWPCFGGMMFHPIADDGDVIYVSGSNVAATAAAVPYQPNDILAYDTRTGSWSLFFDGATAGLPANSDINAFLLYGNRIAMSFAGLTNVPGIGVVDAADVVLYNPTSNGFTYVLDGSDVYLDNADGGIDALAISADNRLLISTGGPVLYDGVNTSQDEDVLAFNKISWGPNTQGTWDLYVDGSDIGLGDNDNADIRGMWVDTAAGTLHFTPKDAVTVNSVALDRNDVAACALTATGANTACTDLALYWDGGSVGMGNFYLDGLSIVRPAAAPPARGLFGD